MYGRKEGDSRVRFIGEGSVQSQVILVTVVMNTNFNNVDMQKYNGVLPKYFVNTFQVKIQDWNKNF